MQNRPSPSSEYLRVLDAEDGDIVQPPWADFAMEKVLWNVLGVICLREGVDRQTFIQTARRTHVGVAQEAAVRTEIAAYMRGKLPFTRKNVPVYHTLHQSKPADFFGI